MTVDTIIDAIRDAALVPDSQVNYGLTDGLIPPYITVVDYTSSTTYDTSGPAFVEADFVVWVYASNLADAEDLAEAVDGVCGAFPSDLSPTALGCFLDGYSVGQIESLYQWAVSLKYHLTQAAS